MVNYLKVFPYSFRGWRLQSPTLRFEYDKDDLLGIRNGREDIFGSLVRVLDVPGSIPYAGIHGRKSGELQIVGGIWNVEDVMRRKEFMKSAAGACLACAGGSFLGGQETKPPVDKGEQERRAREFEKRFKEEYIRTLMENMENRLDEKTRVKLMNDCGRACARRGGLYKMALDNQGEIKKFVQTSAKRLGKDQVYFQDETTVHWSYPRCYCELVAEGPSRLPDAYCHCSVGWVLEMFETVLQRPVKVDLLQSIKRGGSSCVFLVHL